MSYADQRAMTNRQGHIVLDSGLELPVDCLLDTGCSNANYMSGTFFDSNRELLEPYSSPSYGSVYFADHTRKQAFDTKVTLPLRFVGDNGCLYLRTLDFNVLPEKGRDIIYCRHASVGD